MPLLILLVLCVAACFQDDMTDQLSSLTVTRTVEVVLGSTILGEYPHIDYQGAVGTLYAGSQTIYFTGMASYLFLERKTEVLTWQSVKQIQKVNDHGVEIIVVNEATLQEISHVFTVTDHGFDRDKMWAFLMSLYNDALVDYATTSSTVKRASPRAGSIIKRTNSDPLLLASASATQTSHPSSSSLDHEEKKSPDSMQTDPAGSKRPSMNLSQAASAYLDQQLLAQAGAATLDIQSVEAYAGKLALQPIPCQYNTVDGKLYAGKTAIYFVGRRFFLWSKQEVLVPWDTIKKVQLLEGQSQANEKVPIGCQVITKDENEPSTVVYSFMDVDNASQVVYSLQELHNEHLRSGRRQSRSVRRTNSDPLLASHADLENLVVDDKEAATAPQALVVPEAMIRTQLPKKPQLNPKEGWAQVVSEKEFPNKIVRDHLLDCDLGRFYDTFLSDDAKYSIANFLQSRGDSNLKASTWTKDGIKETRTISYTHPVNAPMAPPQADARKEQLLRRYGSHGLVVETKTIVQDVPMTDCFYVIDRIRAESRDGKVAVSMEFDIVFVKSTMFKGIISRTTTSEFTALIQALAVYMSETLGEAVTGSAVLEPEVKPEPATFWHSLLQQPLLPFLVSIVIMQLFIWRDVRRTQASVKLLEVAIESIFQLQQQTASCTASDMPNNG